MLVGSLLGGALKDHFSRHSVWMMSALLLLLAAGTAAVPFSSDLAVLWVTFFIAGVAFNAGQASMITLYLICNLTPTPNHPRPMNYFVVLKQPFVHDFLDYTLPPVSVTEMVKPSVH